MAQRKSGTGKSSAGKSGNTTTTKASAKRPKIAMMAAERPLRIVDSGIKPAAPKAYASFSVTDDKNRKWELPVLQGTIGPDVVDVRKLYTDHGLFTYDPGYGS